MTTQDDSMFPRFSDNPARRENFGTAGDALHTDGIRPLPRICNRSFFSLSDSGDTLRLCTRPCSSVSETHPFPFPPPLSYYQDRDRREIHSRDQIGSNLNTWYTRTSTLLRKSSSSSLLLLCRYLLK